MNDRKTKHFIQCIDITDEQAHDADHAEKILFYIPNDTLVEEQVRDVNLADALIEFSSSFDTGSVLRTVTSDKYTYCVIFIGFRLDITFANGRMIPGSVWCWIGLHT